MIYLIIYEVLPRAFLLKAFDRAYVLGHTIEYVGCLVALLCIVQH